MAEIKQTSNETSNENNETTKKNKTPKFLQEAEKIVKGWKEADKTYNGDGDENGIENKDIRNKYISYQNKYISYQNKYISYQKKYENIKSSYEEIGKKTKENLKSLKNKVEKMKKQNTKDETIKTMASIVSVIEEDNKDGKFNKIINNLGFKNIKKIYSNKDNLELVIKKLQSKKDKTKNEIQLLAYLQPISNFYKYAEKGGVKIDLEKESGLFKKEVKNFTKEKKEYDKNYKEYEEKRLKEINGNDKNKYPENGIDYSIKEPTQNDDGTYSITIDGKKITDVTEDEYTEIESNPEALQNFVNMKEILDILNIPFAWKKRNDLIPQMKKYGEFNNSFDDVENSDSNLLTKEGFNNYLKFLIALTGNKYSNININDNFNTIRKINKEIIFGEKINNQSNFGPFGQKLVKNGVFNNNGIFDSIIADTKIPKILEQKK